MPAGLDELLQTIFKKSKKELSWHQNTGWTLHHPWYLCVSYIQIAILDTSCHLLVYSRVGKYISDNGRQAKKKNWNDLLLKEGYSLKLIPGLVSIVVAKACGKIALMPGHSDFVDSNYKNWSKYWKQKWKPFRVDWSCSKKESWNWMSACRRSRMIF